MKAYIYINPNAPAEVKVLVAENFLDVSRVSSVFMQEVTGGFVDEGPPLSAYAAVLLDEEGELHLLEPVIRDTDKEISLSLPVWLGVGINESAAQFKQRISPKLGGG